jgi:hypothetical protein
LTSLDLRTWIGVSCWHDCHTGSHFHATLFDQISMIWRATSVRCFDVIMDYFLGIFLILIAGLVMLCAAAALTVLNSDEATYYSVINNEDSMIDHRNTIYIYIYTHHP